MFGFNGSTWPPVTKWILSRLLEGPAFQQQYFARNFIQVFFSRALPAARNTVCSMEPVATPSSLEREEERKERKERKEKSYSLVLAFGLLASNSLARDKLEAMRLPHVAFVGVKELHLWKIDDSFQAHALTLSITSEVIELAEKRGEERKKLLKEMKMKKKKKKKK